MDIRLYLIEDNVFRYAFTHEIVIETNKLLEAFSFNVIDGNNVVMNDWPFPNWSLPVFYDQFTPDSDSNNPAKMAVLKLLTDPDKIMEIILDQQSIILLDFKLLLSFDDDNKEAIADCTSILEDKINRSLPDAILWAHSFKESINVGDRLSHLIAGVRLSLNIPFITVSMEADQVITVKNPINIHGEPKTIYSCSNLPDQRHLDRDSNGDMQLVRAYKQSVIPISQLLKKLIVDTFGSVNYHADSAIDAALKMFSEPWRTDLHDRNKYHWNPFINEKQNISDLTFIRHWHHDVIDSEKYYCQLVKNWLGKIVNDINEEINIDANSVKSLMMLEDGAVEVNKNLLVDITRNSDCEILQQLGNIILQRTTSWPIELPYLKDGNGEFTDVYPLRKTIQVEVLNHLLTVMEISHNNPVKMMGKGDRWKLPIVPALPFFVSLRAFLFELEKTGAPAVRIDFDRMYNDENKSIYKITIHFAANKPTFGLSRKFLADMTNGNLSKCLQNLKWAQINASDINCGKNYWDWAFTRPKHGIEGEKLAPCVALHFVPNAVHIIWM